MTEQRRVYQVYESTPSEMVRQLNYVFSLLAERLDQMEGFRGTPFFWKAPKSTDIATEDNELPTFEQLTSDIAAHTGDTTNPHEVTFTQAGAAPLSHVSDTGNPHAVTATQATASPYLAALGLQQTGATAQAQLDALLEHLSQFEQRRTYPWEAQYAPGQHANGSFTGTQPGDQRIPWKKITASSVTLTGGTSADTVADLRAGNDGNVYTVTEQAGTANDLIVDFVDVTAFTFVRIAGSYEGSATHVLHVQLYNWVTSAWDHYDAIQDGFSDTGASLGDHSFFVQSTAQYIGTGANAGEVRVQIEHSASTVNNHKWYFAEVALYQ